MKIHFIAIGGSVMHNLAITLHKEGHQVTGSDDEIYEPAKSKLEKYGISPSAKGWDPGKISSDTDVAILGMHARPDNPELLKAKDMGINIYSFPEYLYERTKSKKRIVIAGSHGKTTITSMVLHVLHNQGAAFDYMVGSSIEGFETMTSLNEDTSLAVFEGDEYLSSALDMRPKFLHYKPYIALITGIAWDHMNVFQSPEIYNKQFSLFTDSIQKGGMLIYNPEDAELNELIKRTTADIEIKPYYSPVYEYRDGNASIQYSGKSYEVGFFGRHNIQNTGGAMEICKQLGISEDAFLTSIQSFRGAARRQELLAGNKDAAVYLDFAHAPSKVKATVEAFRERFPDRKLTTFLELHTFSSLNADFIPGYKGTMDAADEAVVFYDPAVILHKKLPPLNEEKVSEAFGNRNIKIITDSGKMEKYLLQIPRENSIILIMTSGNFSGLEIRRIAKKMISG